MERVSQEEPPSLDFIIHKGLQIAGAVQHMNDQDGLLFVKIAIEDHVFWKAGNEYPSQPRKSRGAKAARRSTLRQTQQGVHCQIDGLLPSLSQSKVGVLLVIVRLLDNREGSRLGNAKFNHGWTSFSRRTATRVRPLNSSGVITNSLL